MKGALWKLVAAALMVFAVSASTVVVRIQWPFQDPERPQRASRPISMTPLTHSQSNRLPMPTTAKRSVSTHPILRPPAPGSGRTPAGPTEGTAVNSLVTGGENAILEMLIAWLTTPVSRRYQPWTCRQTDQNV